MHGVTKLITAYSIYVDKKNQFFYTTKNIGQSGGASQWRVCYQRGLPRLVYSPFKLLFKPFC